MKPKVMISLGFSACLRETYPQAVNKAEFCSVCKGLKGPVEDCVMHEDGLRRKRLALLRMRKLDLRAHSLRHAAKSLAPNKPVMTPRPRKTITHNRPAS